MNRSGRVWEVEKRVTAFATTLFSEKPSSEHKSDLIISFALPGREDGREIGMKACGFLKSEEG
jgi:hypothetical protein